MNSIQLATFWRLLTIFHPPSSHFHPSRPTPSHLSIDEKSKLRVRMRLKRARWWRSSCRVKVNEWNWINDNKFETDRSNWWWWESCLALNGCELVDHNFYPALSQKRRDMEVFLIAQQPPPRWLGVVISTQPAENYCNLIIKQFKCKISFFHPDWLRAIELLFPLELT